MKAAERFASYQRFSTSANAVQAVRPEGMQESRVYPNMYLACIPCLLQARRMKAIMRAAGVIPWR